MENINPREYRNKLAKDLKDARKTDPVKAKEMLLQAQQTEIYNQAKNSSEKNDHQSLGYGSLKLTELEIPLRNKKIELSEEEQNSIEKKLIEKLDSITSDEIFEASGYNVRYHVRYTDNVKIRSKKIKNFEVFTDCIVAVFDFDMEWDEFSNDPGKWREKGHVIYTKAFDKKTFEPIRALNIQHETSNEPTDYYARQLRGDVTYGITKGYSPKKILDIDLGKDGYLLFENDEGSIVKHPDNYTLASRGIILEKKSKEDQNKKETVSN